MKLIRKISVLLAILGVTVSFNFMNTKIVNNPKREISDNMVNASKYTEHLQAYTMTNIDKNEIFITEEEALRKTEEFIPESSNEEFVDILSSLYPYVSYKEGQLIIKVPPSSIYPTAIDTNTTSNQNAPKLQVETYNKLKAVAESCIGTPYVWGGTTFQKGMDCSGFVQYVYKQLGCDIPRVSKDQSKYGQLVKRDELLPGDLLFFDTTNYRDKTDIKTPQSEYEYAQQIASGYVPNIVSHVGMYMGNGQMIHASSGHGYVTYESLEKDYYRNRFINARRLIKWD